MCSLEVSPSVSFGELTVLLLNPPASFVPQGFLASFFSLPCDFVKTRLQKQKPDANGVMPYKSTMDCIGQVRCSSRKRVSLASSSVLEVNSELKPCNMWGVVVVTGVAQRRHHVILARFPHVLHAYRSACHDHPHRARLPQSQLGQGRLVKCTLLVYIYFCQ